MKRLNIRKIAALVLGAATLAGSVVAAEVSYGNIPIVNENGVPQVKVVVGARAAASDGVAAANLAALIGNLAYKSQDITATVQGTPTCSVTGGASGSCPVTDEKVTLNVTIPGTVTGAYGFTTYIADYVDQKTKNRNMSTTDDQDADSPFQVMASANASKKITGSNFASLATSTLTDSYGGKSYTEEQYLWVKAKTKYDTTIKAVVANYPAVGYVIKFTHDQYGIPICTDRNSSNGDWGTCSDSDKTDRHRVKIKFLGEDWIISEMTRPTTALTSPTNNLTGGTIKLAKESSYGVIHIGENMTAGAYVVKLADITVATGLTYDAKASIQIFDANGVMLKEDQVSPGSTYTWNAPDGTKVRIKVYKTNPGYTLQAKWAEMAVYSQEKTLEDAKKLDDDNPDWNVKLIWKNKDYSSSVVSPGTLADCLQQIWLYDEAPGNAMVNLQKGQAFNIVTKPTPWQLQFDGLNLGDSDYDSLSYNVLTGISMTTLDDSGAQCNTSQGTNLNLVSVQSSMSEPFTIAGQQVNQFYIDLANSAAQTWKLYYKLSGESCYRNTTVATTTGTLTTGIKYDTGDEKKLYIFPSHVGFLAASNNANLTLTVYEPAGKVNDADAYDMLNVSIGGDYKFISTTKANYTETGSTIASSGEVDEGYITERGSNFVSVDSTAASFKIAKKVAEAQFYAKSSGQAVGETQLVTLREKESQSFAGGIVIQVASIDETVGGCTAGEGACTVDKSGLTAVPSQTKAYVVSEISLPLVLLDSEAMAEKGSAMILVGGPVVNELTKEAVQQSAIDFASEKQVVKQIGNKIVVAGYSAADTVAAVDKLINDLNGQRA